MSDNTSASPDAGKLDLATLTQFRPAEIKTYHHTTYDRISPSKTFDGKNKTVLVTAGATGIGLSVAESFAQSGVEHLVLIQRRQEVLDAAKQTLSAKYPNTKITTYAASVTDYDRITTILKEIAKIDILVANAASSHPFLPSGQISTEDFKSTFETNVVSTFHIIKEFLALKSSGPRVVITTSSATGQITQPGTIGYGPSKAAMNQMMQYFAMENADSDVAIMNFHPGAIKTESAVRVTGEGFFIWEDVSLPGNFAVWLASDEAKFLAGKFVWAQWDVDELLSLKDRLAENPALLTTTVIL